MRVVILLSVPMVLFTGCARQTDSDIPPPQQRHASVMDINPGQQHTGIYQPPPQPQVIQVQPYEPAPVMAEPVANAPLVTETPVAPAARSHTIQRGDTLYSLARQYYGDGKQWEKIAAANPGINPHGLAVGQTIAIP